MSKDADKPDEKDDKPKGMFERAIGGLSDLFGALSGETPAVAGAARFYQAVTMNRLSEVRQLLENGFDADTVLNATGDRALHICARKNLVDMAALLGSFGADPLLGRKDAPDYLPIDAAVEAAHPAMTSYLARHGGYPAPRAEPPEDLSAETYKGAPRHWQPLCRAAYLGARPVVEALIKAGADPNEETPNGTPALLIAVQKNHFNVVQAMIAAPAVCARINQLTSKSDPAQRTALYLAVENGQRPLVDLLIRAGALVNAPNADGERPLHAAAVNGDLGILSALVDAGGDLNINHKDAGTALYAVCAAEFAPRAPRAAMVQKLLSGGADPDMAHPATGRTPLMEAVLAADGGASVAHLLDAGADAEKKDNDGGSALFDALAWGDARMTTLLLSRGADPDIRHGADAATPLIRAARFNRPLSHAEALLAAGANPAGRDAFGKSALAYARENNDQKLVALLEKALLNRLPGKKPSSNPPKNAP